MKLRKFEGYLHEKLRDPEYAVVYLQIVLEFDTIEEFLYALGDGDFAQGGVQKVAANSRHGRESLLKTSSKQGNPRVKTLDAVLHTLRMRLTVARAAAPVDQEQSSGSVVA